MVSRASIAALLSVGAALLGGSVRAGQSDYWLIGAATDDSAYQYVDVSTLAADADGNKAIWVTWILEGRAATAGGGKRQVVREIIDCARHRSGLKAFVRYAASGAIIDSDSKEHAELEAAAPESMSAGVMAFVCSPSDTWRANRNYLHLTAGGDPQLNADMIYLMAHQSTKAAKHRR
jgi:hypothetical protein